MRVELRGETVHIDGIPVYADRPGADPRVVGRLMNSRMVQAIFDDENPETRPHWAYPDTGRWDPDRNTEEFCAALPAYHAHGLRAVTVGMQGGGSNYRAGIYDRYLNSAFRPDGSLKPAYADRLRRVLGAADRAGIAVIVNLFYWRQERFENDAAILRAVRETMELLLDGGWTHTLTDLKNEVVPGPGLLAMGRLREPLRLMHDIRAEAGWPLIGCSTMPKRHLEPGAWQELVEYWMPHGNDSGPSQLAAEIEEIRALPSHQGRPRPIFVNEDSIFIENMEAALDAGAGWGYYDQGYGSEGVHGRFDWTTHPREDRFEDLSGFQTVPVNWGINTPHKRAFFDRLRCLTGH